jgi:hypothetical protein
VLLSTLSFDKVKDAFLFVNLLIIIRKMMSIGNRHDGMNT